MSSKRFEIIDYLLADPDLSLDEVIDIIDFHMITKDPTEINEIKEDLRHAFS